MNFLLQHIEEIIKGYPGSPPLAAYLKAYFKMHSRLGSRDRRAISEAVYIYYRCARFATDPLNILGIISQGIHICNSENRFLKDTLLKNGFSPVVVDDDIDFVFEEVSPECSQGIKQAAWIQSMFQQPEVFIRICRDKEQMLSILKQSGIPFQVMDTNIAGDKDLQFYEERGCCVSLPGGSKLDNLLPAAAYVVQDWASQCSLAVAAKFWDTYPQRMSPVSVWDACAGAGGKTLFWKDKYPKHEMLASDVRKSILHNLRARLSRYEVSGVKTQAIDATQQAEMLQKAGAQKFDIVICDVPCSGSGTWSRTPEQLYFFREESLGKFRHLQLPIGLNAQSRLKPGGLLFYITCSVFAAENESVVEQLLQQSSLKLLHQQLINGLAKGADSMFIAVFQS